ncbi:MAG TPA: PKD domain-containing protein [Thermoplasmata archaeon]|nr:PKD domain-containing protein [Thermoplasmata archaeon]
MPRYWALIASFAIVTLMVLGGVVAFPAGAAATTPLAPFSPAHAGLKVAADPTRSASLVSAAVSSLNHGAGPARGTSAGCQVTAAGQASCGAPPIHSSAAPRAARPASSPRPILAGGPQWYNVTASLRTASSNVTPSIDFAGRLAYDPLLNEVVLFNGCSGTQCPSNQTWTYNGTTWTNLTGSLLTAPSAREGAGLDYDPTFGGVVLFGGTNSSGGNLDDTWVFTASGWANITGTVGAPLAAGSGVVTWSWGAMAFDPALDSMVVVDGCVDSLCTNVWGQTFFLNATGWSWAWGPGTLTNRTYLAYDSVAYDATDATLVEFGGYDAYAATSLNLTFLFNVTTGNWDNITNHDAGCVGGTCYTPPARDSDVMTWDSQLNAILMTDGYNDTSGSWYNDSWLFSGNAWYPANLTAPTAPASYCAAAQPGMPEMSNNIAPFILGGYGPCAPGGYANEYVYEVAPHPTLSVAPHAVDLGVSTTFTYGWTVGSGTGVVASWNVSFGDGHSSTPARAVTGANSSVAHSVGVAHTYATVGTFTANVTWTDFYYIAGTLSGVTVTVTPALVATIIASATTIKAGGSVTFSTSPTGGSGGYTYSWQFGDAATSTVQAPPAHTYARAGTYTVNLTVTDSVGQSVKSTVVITVNPAPAAGGSLLGGSTGTYLLVGVVVVVLAILAALLLMRRRKPTTAPPAWQAGPPSPAGPGAPPPGVSGGMPPGVGAPPPSPPPPPPPS